eukprot:m.57560 g.57560  ORF g.57560 m.57560 type:complete len:204 (-) comp17108_c0_seq1:742-1353(-)
MASTASASPSRRLPRGHRQTGYTGAARSKALPQCDRPATKLCDSAAAAELKPSPVDPPSLDMFDFEVFGRVQHVSFRKYTKEYAERLGVVGWVKNSELGTVVGRAAGPARSMALFRKWLQTRGSPSASISRAEFTNEHVVVTAPFKRFKVDKTPLTNGKQHAPREVLKVGANDVSQAGRLPVSGTSKTKSKKGAVGVKKSATK